MIFLCPFVMVYISLMTQIALRMFDRIGWIRANLDIIQI